MINENNVGKGALVGINLLGGFSIMVIKTMLT
jgi:hypothetical protein